VSHPPHPLSKLPGGHFLQTVAPASDVNPEGHFEHTVCPEAEVNEFAAQGSHSFALVEGFLDSVDLVPAGQGVQELAFPVEYVPGPHGLHAPRLVAPVGEYVPAGQDAQDVAPSSEYVPGAQGLHVDESFAPP